MRTTFTIVAALGVVSLACACDEDKKPTEATPSATVAAPVASAPPAAPKATPADAFTKNLTSWIAAWNAHDPAKVAASYEATGKLTHAGYPDASGRDDLAAQAKETFTSFSNLKVTTTRAFVRDNTALVEWVFNGKNDGGPKPSGQSVGVAGGSVLLFDDDGLFKEEHRYFDNPTLASQLDPKAKAGTFRAPLAAPTAPMDLRIAKGTPDDAKTLATGKAVYAAFEGMKDADVPPLFSDDTTIDDYTFPTTFKGTKGTMDYVHSFWTAFPSLTQTKPVQFAVGDVVLTEGIFNGVQKGPMGPIKPSNKPVTFHFIDIIQIKDGKVLHIDSFGNSGEILVAIGAMPPPAPSASVVAAAVPAPTMKPQ
jgi:predicted ester cyclase